MALVNSAFTVNVTPGAMPPIVHVSEYDVGRTYTVTINGENGSAFNIPTGTTATVEGTLNGSVGFTQSATISNNQVSFALSKSMTAYAGKAWCKIKLTLNDEPIQTCAFILAVDRAGVEAVDVIGAPGFEEQITDAVYDWLDEHKADEFDYEDKSVSGNPLSFNDGAGSAVKSLIIQMQTEWSGEGDPSPTNVRPISGGTGISLTAKDKSTTPVGVVYDASWVDKWSDNGVLQSKSWLTEGELNVLTGELTVRAILDVFDTYSEVNSVKYISSTLFQYSSAAGAPSIIGDYTRVGMQRRSNVDTSNYYLTSNKAAFGTPMCNLLKHRFSNAEESASWYMNSGSLTVKFPTSLIGSTAASVVEYLRSIKDTTPLMIRIPLIEPETYQLTPQEVQTLVGANYITSNLGTMNMTYTARSEKEEEPLVSPTVDIEAIEGGNRVTITDVDGDHTFDVMDGEDAEIDTEQIEALSTLVDQIAEDIDLTVNVNQMPEIKPGFYASSDGSYNGTRKDYVCSANLIPVQEGDVLSLVGDINYSGWYLNKFAADGTYISSQSYSKSILTATIPSGVGFVGLSFNFGTSADRTIDDVPAVYINYQAGNVKTIAERVSALEENESGSTSELFDYSPINFTAAAGWRGNAIYSTNSHYHVDIPVQEGEKFHIKTRTDSTSMYAAGYFPNSNFNSITKALDGAATGFVEGYITVPSGAAYLTVNCAKAYSVVIEKYGLKADAETDLPSYFADEVDAVVETAKGHCTEKSLVFAVVTDSHLNAAYGYQVWNDTIKNIAAVNAKYPLDGIVHMGDIINGDAESSVGLEQLDKARSDFLSISKNAVFLEGNHDLNSFYNSNADPINEAAMFSEVFRFNDTEIVRPDGKLYGFRDYDALGVRVVYLHSSMGDGTHGGRGDNWGYPSDELTWVQNVALDTEYQVLFISHMPMTQGYISDASTIPTNGNALKTIVSDFIDNGGVVVGLLHGHTHWDDIFDNGKFKEVSVGCEDYTYTPNDVVGTNIHSYTPATAVKPARMRYTVTQDLWDVIIVRPASRTVKLVRFGAGTDRAYSY